VRFRKNSTAKKLKKTQFFRKNSIFSETQPDFNKFYLIQNQKRPKILQKTQPKSQKTEFLDISVAAISQKTHKKKSLV